MGRDVSGVRTHPPRTEQDFTMAMAYAVGRGAPEIVRELLRERDQRATRWSLADDLMARAVLSLSVNRRSPAEPGRWGGAPSSESQAIEVIQLLLAAGAPADDPGTRPQSLNYLAEMKDSEAALSVLRSLLDRGAAVDAASTTDAYRRSPLIKATANPPALTLLLERRTFDPATIDAAFIAAVYAHEFESAMLLMSHGATVQEKKVSAVLPQGWQAFQIWFNTRRGARDFFVAYVRRGANPEGPLPDSEPWLMTFVHDPAIAELLLASGADVNRRDRSGATALHRAVERPAEVSRMAGDARPLAERYPALDPAVRLRAVRMLLDHGADAHVRNAAGASAVMETTAEDAAAIHLLMAKGAPVVVDGPAGAYYAQYKAPVGPVSWSLLARNEPLAVALLKRDGNDREKDCGAVYYAAATGASDALGLLLDLRAPTSVISRDQRTTPLMAAAEKGHTVAVRLMLDRRAATVDEATAVRTVLAVGHGAFPVPVSIGGTTALMYAARAGRVEVIGLLLERGANINRKDAGGATALTLAKSAGQTAAAQLLEARGGI